MKKVLLLLTLFVVGIWVAWAQNRPFIANWGANSKGELHLPVKGTNWKLEVWKDGNKVKSETVEYSDENDKIHVVKDERIIGNVFYDVWIYPEGVEYIRCGSDKAKETAKLLGRILDWGNIQWTSMERAFAGCTQLYKLGQGEPDLSKVKSCKEMFKGCAPFNSSLNTWNMENVENLENILDGCKYYDFTMESWTLVSAKKISFGKVAKFSKNTYERTIIGWANNPKTASDVVFDAKDMLYSSLEAKAAHDKLVKEKGWTINGDKYILFKFHQPVYYCKVGSSINVRMDFAQGIEESAIRYTVPIGDPVIKVKDQGTAEIGGLTVGKATLTAKVKFGELDLETTCEVIVNETGEAPSHKLILKQSGTGAGMLNVRTKNDDEKIDLGEYNLPNGTKLLVNVDYDKSLATLELQINNENKTSVLDYGDYELTLDRDYTIEAILTEIKQWKVEFAAAKNGRMSVQGKNGAQLEAGKENKTPDGTLIVVSLAADAGYVLEAFRVNKEVREIMGATHSFELKQDVRIDAFFSKANERSVVLDVVGGATNGTVKIGHRILAEGVNKVPKNSQQKVTVKANEGYRVKSFTIAGEDKLAEAEKGVEVTFDKVVDIAVEFEEEMNKIHVNWTEPEAEQGTITVHNHKNQAVSNGGEVPIHMTIKVEVKPTRKYNLVELKAGNVNLLPTKKGNVYTYVVETTDVTLTYRFELKPVSQTVKVRFNIPAVTAGTISVTDASGNNVANGGEVKKNSIITIKAEPAAGYTLKSLTANWKDLMPKYNTETHSVTYVVQEDDVKIMVAFEKPAPTPNEEEVEVTLSVIGVLNGKVKVGEQELVSGVNKVKKGKRQKVTAKADKGFRLKTFTIGGISKLAEANTGVDIAFTRAVAIAVAFETTTQEEGDKTVVLTVVQPQDGAIVVKGSDGKTLASGTKIEKGTINITVTPNAQYELEWLKINEEDFTEKVNKETRSVSYEVQADVTIRAKFKKGADDPSTAVEDAFLANVIVAPNPFTRALRIMGNEVSGVRYELFNAQGVVVRAGSVDTTEVVIDTEELVSGLYWVRLSDGKGAMRVYRVVKQ